MALHYQTEYRLGRRGRVSRSYTGVRALVAIFLDLTVGMLFEVTAGVVGLLLRLIALALELLVRILKVHWRIMIVVMTMFVYVLTTPFVILHRLAERVRWKRRRHYLKSLADEGYIFRLAERVRWQRQHPTPRAHSTPAQKPDWGFAHEL
jgi:hypothetical protein